MPPKSADKRSKVTFLKCKRDKITYVLPIYLTTKSGKSMKSIKEALVEIINESGGLRSAEDEAGMDIEDDIEIPKSEFIDDDEQDEIKDAIMENSVPLAKTVTSEEIRLAIPKDKSSPYSNRWVEATDEILADLELNDFDLLAFAYDNEPFHIVEAAYEEE